NPAISVNGLFLGFYTSGPFTRHPAFENEHDDEGEEEMHEEDVHADEEPAHAHGLPENPGMSVQEVEVRFTAFVDAYLKADLILAIPGAEGLEVEEAVLSTVSLPGITLSAGKLYAPFGKHNSLHTHAYPFIDPPISNEKILGGEGLNEVGFGANILLPASWYSEFTAQVLNGDNEVFASPDGEDLAFVGRWKNLWDLNDATTLELSGSYGTGKNMHKELTHLLGGDLTIKWRPLRHVRDRGITFQTEYLQARVNDGLQTKTAGGLYAQLQIQTARRWWVQGRYDVFGFPKLEPEREHRFSGLLAFAPSEFSAIRLQYNLNREDGQNVHQLALQLNFTLGAHPAHSY
ncbi:MAG: hypothetical protein O2954_06140, partial [bacterium]|nr:hypothetical protein [bacterium]